MLTLMSRTVHFSYCMAMILTLAACSRETPLPWPTLVSPLPTLTVAVTGVPDSLVEPSPAPVLQGYPITGEFAPSTPMPSPTGQGYPIGPVDFPAPPAPAIVEWSVPVTEVTGANVLLPLDFPPVSPIPALNVECDLVNVTLYLTDYTGILDEANLNTLTNGNPNCPTKIDVAQNGSAVALVFPLGDINVWLADVSAPRKVGRMPSQMANYLYTSLWSPDSERLAFIAIERDADLKATLQVVDKMGRLLAQFEVGGGSDGENLYWLAADVLCRGDRSSSPCYQASTGQFAFRLQGWHILTAGVKAQQPPSISPDQRWVLLDEGYFDRQIDGPAGIRQVYTLFDTHSLTNYTLPASGENPIAFAGWKQNSTTAYLVSRPRQADSLPASGMPFGLLALDLKTRQIELLFKESVQVTWSRDQRWAFVTFPARNAEDALGLVGGAWEVGTKNLFGRVTLATEMVYSDPAWEGYNRLGTAAWAHNGRWVVFGNALGQLHLLGIDGVVRQLASDILRASWLQANYTWSEDDTRLLVEHEGRAWIVTIPNP